MGDSESLNTHDSPSEGSSARDERERLRRALDDARARGDAEAHVEVGTDLLLLYVEQEDVGLVDEAATDQLMLDLGDVLERELANDAAGLSDEERRSWEDARIGLAGLAAAVRLKRASRRAADLARELKQHSAEAARLVGELSFAPAADEWDQVARVAEACAALTSEPLPEGDHELEDAWEDLNRRARVFEQLAPAMRSLCLGHEARLRRNGEAALEGYTVAKTGFELAAALPGGRAWVVFAEYADALATLSSGIVRLQRSDYASAAALILQARVALERVLEQAIPQASRDGEFAEMLRDAESGIRRDLAGVVAAFNFTKFLDLKARRDWRGALRYADAYVAATEDALAATPDEATSMNDLLRFQLESGRGQREIVVGELQKDEKRWDDAIAAYEAARSHFDEAARRILRSRLPDAAALQESLLNETASSLDLLTRDAETQKELHTELIETKSQLARLQDSLASAGVNVTTINEITTTVQQQAEFVLAKEQQVRDVLAELVESAEASELEPDVKQRLTVPARGVLESGDQGLSLIRRAKDLSADLAAVVKNVGDVAKPVAVAAGKLALLVAAVT